MKKLHFIVLLLYSTILTAQIPDGYYDDASGKTGYELKTALKTIITDGYVTYTYDDLYTIYEDSDTDHYYENDGTVMDMYSENPSGADAYEYTHYSNTCGTYSEEGDCYNREHIVPQSVFDSESPMKSDAHFVVPTDGYVNGRRSNYPFGIVENPTWTSTNGSKVGPNTTSGYVDTVFEPIDEFKGDIARMLFYFATRYEDQVADWSHDMFNGTSDQVFADWFLAILLDWHQADPVSQKEIDRNNAVYEYQKNRNPYIDHPEWVNDIWGGTYDGGTDDNTDGDTNTGSEVTLKVMDFDGTTPEWSFTTNVPFFDHGYDGFYGIYNANGDSTDGTPEDTGVGNASDVDVIDNPTITGDFLFVNDLYDEGDNGTSGEAVLTFDSVDTSNYTDLVFSFDYDMSGFDSADYIRYELFENGSSIGEMTVTANTEGTITYELSAGVTSFYVAFKIKQDGASDQGALDNIILKGVQSGTTSEPACTAVTLNLTFDNYPEETSWELTTSSGDIVASGGTYEDEADGSTLSIPMCLDSDCYTLTVKDSYGDGMCCNYGEGSYSLVIDDTQDVLASGGSFQYEQATDFCLGVAGRPSQITETEIQENIFSVCPNPVNDILTIKINDDKMQQYEIWDLSGKMVKTGANLNTPVLVSDLRPGLYIIKISSDKKSLVKKFLKL